MCEVETAESLCMCLYLRICLCLSLRLRFMFARYGSKVKTTEVKRAESLCDEVELGSVCDTQIVPKFFR